MHFRECVHHFPERFDDVPLNCLGCGADVPFVQAQADRLHVVAHLAKNFRKGDGRSFPFEPGDGPVGLENYRAFKRQKSLQGPPIAWAKRLAAGKALIQVNRLFMDGLLGGQHTRAAGFQRCQ